MVEVSEMTKQQLQQYLSKDEIAGLLAYENYKTKLLNNPANETDLSDDRWKKAVIARLDSVNNRILIFMQKAQIVPDEPIDRAEESSVTKSDGTLKSVKEAFGN